MTKIKKKIVSSPTLFHVDSSLPTTSLQCTDWLTPENRKGLPWLKQNKNETTLKLIERQ